MKTDNVNKQKKEKEIKPGFCPRCKTYNLWNYGDSNECNNCGAIFS